MFFDNLVSLSIKDIGRVRKFLRMRVERKKEGDCTLDQEEAIGDLLRKNRLADANPTPTPFDDYCYEVKEDDAELLETASARAGPTVREF